MIITPVDRPLQWKTPPRLVLGLSLVLSLIFMVWHTADISRQQQLTQQYQRTLMTTEWPLYETHALKTGQRAMLQQLKTEHAAGNNAAVAAYIAMDDGFVAAMHKSGQDYLPTETFDAWKKARAEFDPERNKLSARALGIDPQVFRPITFLTFSLVQPDTLQWLTAVLLLLSAGLALELTLGSGAVLAAFLGGGLTGALAFLLSNGSNVLPLSGASVGAAGVLGMFLMHFRRDPVLYFGRKKARSFWIVPFWVALLALEFFLSSLRTAELIAQITAFASGPLWWLVYQKWFLHEGDLAVVPEGVPEIDHDLAYRESLHQALEAVGRLEFAEGHKRLREMLKASPQDLRILTQLYYVEKLNPSTPSYDATARRLFGLNAAGSDPAILQIYRDYLRFSLDKPALDTETSLKLVLRFTRMNEVMEADKLMKTILERKAAHVLISKAAQALAEAMQRLQEPAKARFYRQLASSG